ncbi:MAG TPA: DNA polymerase I [Alphaproteobacteria bacterium]|jgi:DNA polymerase-1
MAKAPAPPAGDKPHHLYLIDGSGYIFRAYHALPPMTRRDGTPVNAVFGFSQMLLKLIADTETDYLAVIFDAARKNYRNDIYADYKANRPEAPEDLIPQFALIRDAVRAFNVPCIEMEGYEADDLIATYAKAAVANGDEVTVVSSDKDLMQLISDKVGLLDPMKQKRIGHAEVMEKFGVAPEKVLDVLSLAGDAVDNVPGVPGIGYKTAAELINTYGDLDTLLARAGEIKQPKRRENLLANADKARMSRDLVRLEENAPVTEAYTDFGVQPPDPAKLLGFLKEQEFNRLLARVGSDLAARGVKVNDALAEAAAASEAKAIPDSFAPPKLTAHRPGKSDAAPVALGEQQAALLAALSKLPDSKSYTCLQDEDALRLWVARARDAGLVAVDTETTSLDPMRAELVGVSLAIVPGEAAYLPLGHIDPAAETQSSLALDLGAAPGETGGRPRQIPLQTALDLLKPLLEDEGVLKVGHNIKYDRQVLASYGVGIAPVDDSMVLSYVLEGGLHGHGMDDLAELHFGHSTIKYGDVTGSGRKQVTFDRVALDSATCYAAEDADVTLRLHTLLKPRLVSDHMTTVYETLERPLIGVLADMERAGIKVDREVLRGLSADFEKRMHVLEAEIHKLAGREFNVGSPKQLGEVLFDDMSLPGGKKGKTGAYATGADVLEELAAQGHDLPQRVLDWRQIQKLKSTYSDALAEQINPSTGRVHTSYGMTGAATGRLSSNDPNLQNIPIRTEEGRKIRRAFIAEKGCKLLSADYSQIELRLLAHVAGIDTLKTAFRDGLDIHALTASEMFGVPVKGMDPMIRRKAKAINFGIIYGISGFGLANQLGIPQGEASSYIKAYFERYPGIRDYMERTKEIARKQGFVTTIFGRKIHVPWINDKVPSRRSFAERAAINAPLQGAAADIIKRAMIRVPDALKDAGLKAKMLLQVHDELVFEMPEGEAEKTAKVVREVMERATLPALALDVPLIVETGLGDDWAAIH